MMEEVNPNINSVEEAEINELLYEIMRKYFRDGDI